MYTNLGEKNPKVYKILAYSVLLGKLRVQCLIHEQQFFSSFNCLWRISVKYIRQTTRQGFQQLALKQRKNKSLNI